MPKVIIEQYIKEEPELDIDLDTEYETLGAVEEPERFSYLVKFERKISKGKTEIKISYRDTRINMDYRLIHESIDKEDYEIYKNFFKGCGYHKL